MFNAFIILVPIDDVNEVNSLNIIIPEFSTIDKTK